MMQKQSVEESNQRCALSASCLITDAEIGDGGDTSPRSDESSLGHGQGAFGLSFFWHTQQPDSLTVRPDDVNLRHGDVPRFTELLRSQGEGLAEQNVHLREFFGCGSILQNHLHHSTFDALLQWDLAVLVAMLACFLGVLFGGLLVGAQNALEMWGPFV